MSKTLSKPTKKPQRSIKNGDSSNQQVNILVLKDCLTRRETNLGSKFFKALADLEIEWAQKSTSTDMLDFYHSLGVSSKTYDVYVKNEPILQNAHELAVEMVGSRRQKMAEERKLGYNEGIIARTLRLFHPDWDKTVAMEQAAKVQLAGNKQFDIIEVPIVEDCPEVPKRINE